MIGLVGQDPADRLSQRRHAAVQAHLPELVQHLVQPVAGAQHPQPRVEVGDGAHRQPVQRRAEGDPGGIGSAGSWDVTCSSMNRDASHSWSVDAVLEAEAAERVAEHLDDTQCSVHATVSARDRLGAVAG